MSRVTMKCKVKATAYKLNVLTVANDIPDGNEKDCLSIKNLDYAPLLFFFFPKITEIQNKLIWI